MNLKQKLRSAIAAATVAAATLMLCVPADAYSVLSHEQVVDQCWLPVIVPMLQQRFPGLTPDQIAEAHSYAYGGSVIQDIGYYPHGSHFASDLMHYVRSGDFIQNLIQDSTTADEYAFALGALAHYAGDTVGHPTVNKVTAMEYPKLAAKYGDRVTYQEDPTAHLRTEFGFEVVEVARGKYQEQAYHDFIGFHVSKELLDRAFQDTYGLKLNDLSKDEDRAINSYRHDVSTLIPQATRVAWAAYKKDIVAATPTATERTFEYRTRRTDYEHTYGSGYQKPTAKEEFVAFIVRIVPKVGPLKALKLKVPSQTEEDLYLKSMLASEDQFRAYLAQVAASGPDFKSFHLPQTDLDTGRPTEPGEYNLADLTYAKLAEDVTAPNAPPVPNDLRAQIVGFFDADPNATQNFAAKDPAEWAKVQAALQTLKAPATPTAPVSSGQ